MKKSIFFIIALVLFCDEKPSYVDETPFSGYTRTNENGAVLALDKTDWKYEELIAAKLDTLSTGIILPDKNIVFPPYPNPAYERITFKLGLTGNYYITLMIYSIEGEFIREYSPKNFYNTGINTFDWTLKDKFGKRVGQGLYRAIITFYSDYGRKVPIYNCTGDIQVF